MGARFCSRISPVASTSPTATFVPPMSTPKTILSFLSTWTLSNKVGPARLFYNALKFVSNYTKNNSGTIEKASHLGSFLR
jgi:hypothetical protein